MSFSFSINSKSQSRRLKKPSESFSAAADNQAVTFAASTRHYIREFKPDETPPVKKIKPIAPIPNTWPPMNLQNLPNIPSLSQTNGSDSSLQFELDPASNPEATDNSMGYGLNLRQPPAENGGPAAPERHGLKLRKLREDLEKLPEDTGMDEFTDVPVEGFGAALLSVYGWKEGQGIGRNAKEDVKFCEVTKKTGRGGLGFTGEFSANVGKNESVGRRKRIRNPPRKMGGEEESSVTRRVNWLRNHIRVRIISKELKGGRFFLKKGVVVDVVGPGMCSIYMDESRELIQGVEQELLETALPKRGGPVLVLGGRYKGVYGSLLKRDSEKETGIVRDADTHEMLIVRLDQIAEYTGDPSDIGY